TMSLNDLIEELRAKRLREVSEKKTRKKEAPSFSRKPDSHLEAECPDKVRAAVYKKIIERYADTIGLWEEKTIPELKALVNPEDEAIARVKAKLFDEMREGKPAWEYSFEEGFLEFLKAALEYCFKLKPVNADLTVSYWLKPSEIVELQAADPFDKAIFLCSLLESAGGRAKVRVVELEEGGTHAVVLTQWDGKILLLDASCSSEFLADSSEEDVLLKHSFEGKKIGKSLYEFSNAEYSDFEE
ncbi:MAG: hypothetical protein V1717_03065, partial [Candidatus Micrarchaeota archaeon]